MTTIMQSFGFFLLVCTLANAFQPPPLSNPSQSRRTGTLHSRFRTPTSSTVVTMTEERSPAQSSLLAKFCPLLKLVGGSDLSKPRNVVLDTFFSGLASLARLPWGSEVSFLASSRSRIPERPIRLYEFEACPYCRRVRETATFLDLEIEICPCPKEGTNRQEVFKQGGKEMFPFLSDENTGITMYESADIVRYLCKTYGEGSDLPPYLLESTLVSGTIPASSTPH